MARKLTALLGSAVFLVLAPGFVAGLVPWWITHWRLPVPVKAFNLAGILLIAAGSVGLLDSFIRFAIQGLGTPAPVFPTRHLVITGFYRFVRNPMYVAVVSAILGQALFFGSGTLFAYGAFIFTLFHLFVLLYEEPVLKATFSAEYDVFRRNVPRWIPRLTPWRQRS